MKVVIFTFKSFYHWEKNPCYQLNTGWEDSGAGRDVAKKKKKARSLALPGIETRIVSPIA
jgi:hypothetical protein